MVFMVLHMGKHSHFFFFMGYETGKKRRILYGFSCHFQGYYLVLCVHTPKHMWETELQVFPNHLNTIMLGKTRVK